MTESARARLRLELLGNCSTYGDPGAFFEIEDAADEEREPEWDRVEAALRQCLTCEVADECLALAGRDYGIRGGKTAAERGRPYRVTIRKGKGKK